MEARALDIACATEAGLILVGQEDGQPQWMGSKAAFKRFGELVQWVEQTGTYPWVFPF